jgi:CheY-like chemotaxis protein
LLPAPARSGGNYRLYSRAHVERLTFIRHCRVLDMTLAEIRALLALRDAPETPCCGVDALLDQHILQVAERIAELSKLEIQLKKLRGSCAQASTTKECGILNLLLLQHTVLDLPVREADQRRLLLLVDDEPNVLSALKRLLRREGYDILTANSAREGLELLAIYPVQVILSDQRMPEMSGTEFLSRVRDLYPDTIRIVLSDYTDLSTVTDAINRGSIYRFLTKPWDDQALREHLREAFRHFESAEQKLVTA